MNGLTLRINRAGAVQPRNSINFPPVHLTTSFADADENCELFQRFTLATTSDEQLAILKTIQNDYKDNVDGTVIHFLVEVFLQAAAKHPLKCYISRYVTKNQHLQAQFTKALASQILVLISDISTHYQHYKDVVSKVATCIENFNAGVAAVQCVEVNLAKYLKDCLGFCVKILSESTLSPTEKNEIFNLCHLSLRLLLHIVQKANNDDVPELNLLFEGIRSSMQALIFDDDVPMDTKSVCGILYLNMHIMENGSDSWVDIINPSSTDSSLSTLLKAKASKLSLYSAIATVVSADKLHTQLVNGTPAIIALMHQILEIGDRSSSDSTFMLGVTRTLVQISKLLNKTSDAATGQSIVASLLTFAWPHLEHHMDSVRHLTAQMLAIVVQYCAKLDREGDPTLLNKLLLAVNSLDRSRRSYYVSLTCLVDELGSERVMQTWPTIIQDLLVALSSQHIQASVTTALTNLIQKQSRNCTARELHDTWVRAVVAHVHAHELHSTQLSTLENLLLTAVHKDNELIHYILPYIKESSDPTGGTGRDLKCILMLVSVMRNAGVSSKLATSADRLWKGIITYQVLRDAAIDRVDESRILSLSLIVESAKTTEEFSAGELAFILHYLEYNINAQAPCFRQLTLAYMKKFIKRLEDSYKVIKRQKESNEVNNKVEYYLRFLEDLREQCFGSLIPGANYSRRCVALQLLVWCERLNAEGYNRTWKPDYVEKLLVHFEDSYESNKAFALQILCHCPIDIVKTNMYSTSLNIKDIFAQASSLKPTDCVSAAYKFDFLRRRLPEYILQGEQCSVVESVTFTLIVKLLSKLQEELEICERSVVLAARSAPMYGLLHCITHLINTVDPLSISSDSQWTSLVSSIITTCMAVNAGVASVVNNSSPEGHLPMDMSGVLVTDHGNSGGVVLDDGRQVTAQMVLLCAWRSVKEVSLLLGHISSQLSISGEECVTGTLSCDQLVLIGEHFTSLLSETKHRGAFEQAYVGFTKLLNRVWRCRSASLHALPWRWARDLTDMIAADDQGLLCATRRSAGLPFMIQALVTTEVQVESNPKCFQWCMSRLLQLAQCSAHAESRAHALNIARALYRHAATHDTVAPYVGDGLVLALAGFDRDNWMERNSSTLLLSALVGRVFGVSRQRAPDTPCLRNRMTGRIFFLRYPQLYDYMLTKLQEVSSSENTQLLRPSLYPVLLLLARLYPSSLEGTVSNLKLVSFVPHVLSCAASSVLQTRQLAAEAMVPLVSPQLYISHLNSMFALLTPNIKRNYCHGILLQLVRLLDAKPEDLKHPHSLLGVELTLWVLDQAVGDNPCYLIADEYVKVLNLILWRFPNVLQEDTITKIITYLDKLIFNSTKPRITLGREICLANAIYLYFIVLNIYKKNPCEIIFKGLEHKDYEVILSTLNYILILYKNFEDNKCKFLEHLTCTSKEDVIDMLKRNDRYINLLCNILQNTYLECQQKSLKILTLLGDTQKCIIETKYQKKITDDEIIDKLIECLDHAHENLTHVYLESLLNYVSVKVQGSLPAKKWLEVLRVVFEYSSSENNESTRSVVVSFVEKNIDKLMSPDTSGLSDEEIFELKATMWSTIISLLEDDEQSLRQRTSDALTSHWLVTSRVPAACARDVLRRIERDGDTVALLLVVALLDFKSVVVSDDGNDECRVFDQNERYNIFLEETVWTNACADSIIHNYKSETKLIDYVSNIVNNPIYKSTIDNLCKDNILVFKKMVAGEKMYRDVAINPKIELFYNKLCK